LQFQRILIFRTGHLGDTIVALPALWALREAFPKAHIALLSNADAKNPHFVSPDRVLPREGLIDEFLAYPTNMPKAATAAASIKLAARLRLHKFDAVAYLMPRVRSLAQIERDERFFRLAGIKKMIGVDHLKKTRLPETIPVPTPTIESEAQHMLQCLAADGVTGSSKRNTDLILSSDEIDAARNWFINATGRTPNELRLVGVAPGSKWGSKIWPEERFAEIVRRLIDKHRVFPVVFGGAEDREKGDRLIAEWQQGANAAGELPVRASAALLRDCRLYLGNDTGTMHLAAAVGTPCVAVFAAIDWVGKWMPFGDNNRVFRKSVECEGCHSPMCFNNHKCLDLVTADEVYAACAETLNE
jgi:heptosyltransferase III